MLLPYPIVGHRPFEEILHLRTMLPKMNTHKNTFGYLHYNATIISICIIYRKLVIITLLKIATFIIIRCFFSHLILFWTILFLHTSTSPFISFGSRRLICISSSFLYFILSHTSIVREQFSAIFQNYTFSVYYFTDSLILEEENEASLNFPLWIVFFNLIKILMEYFPFFIFQIQSVHQARSTCGLLLINFSCPW